MKPSIFLFLLSFLLPLAGFATHLRGGQIRVVPNPNNPLECSIEITAYVNTGSEINFGGGMLDFGDNSPFHSPLQMASTDLGHGIGVVTYKIIHSYATAGKYVVRYNEPNLNGGILNMFNSLETKFYIETSFTITDDGDFVSPEFPVEPIVITQTNLDYSFSTAVIDNSSNEFFYTYSLITPRKARGQFVAGYELPENLKINKYNGTVTWDTKFHDEYVIGMIWISIIVEKYRANGDYLGYIERAMQIDVEDGESQFDVSSSVNVLNNKVVVTEDNQTVVKLVISDDNDEDNESDFEFELFVSDKIKDHVYLTQYDSVASATDQKFRVGKISVNTLTSIVSDLPYTVLTRARATPNSKHGFIQKDISFLYMTKDLPLPEAPESPDNPDVVTGVKEESQKRINVYPNPFRSELYVDGTEVTIMNNVGQVMMRSPLQKGEPINTSAFPTGLYILKIVSEDNSTNTVKIIRD